MTHLIEKSGKPVWTNDAFVSISFANVDDVLCILNSGQLIVIIQRKCSIIYDEEAPKASRCIPYSSINRCIELTMIGAL